MRQFPAHGTFLDFGLSGECKRVAVCLAGLYVLLSVVLDPEREVGGFTKILPSLRAPVCLCIYG